MSFLSTPISLFPIKPVRQIGDITVNVIINETSRDNLTITKQPVQQGATITDHAFKEPTIFSCKILFQDNLTKSLSKVYQDLLDLQASRVPFNIVTPKRIYYSMLLTSVGVDTDKSTENCLAVLLAAEEVIIVKVTTTQVPRQKQKKPAKTGKTENVGKKSILANVSEGVTALFK